MDFEFIFRISLVSSVILLSLVLVLAIGLVITKFLRQIWAKYSSSRGTFYLPLILQAIAGETDAFSASLFRAKRRFGDWKIVELEILKWSGSIRGFGHKKLCRIFEETGFADYEIRRLKSFRWWIRAQAAQRLGQMLCSKASPALEQVLEDRSFEVRLTASWALAKLGDSKAVDRIVQSLAHSSKLAAARLTNIILEMGPQTIPTLKRLLENEDTEVKLMAIKLLGILKEKGIVELLAPLLGLRNIEIRIAVIQALGNIDDDDEKAAFLILRYLDDTRWPVRAKAASVLGRLKHAPAIPKLKENLKDRAWWVRHHSGEGLARLGEGGKKALAESLSSEDRFARETAAEWLAELEAGAIR